MNYADIFEVARLHKGEILEDMRINAMSSFMSRVNHEGFDDEKELREIKIVDESLKRVNELLDKVLDKMEKGARQNG